MNPKIKHVLWVAVFIVSALPAQAQDTDVEMGVVTANRLNVRGRPLATAEIACQLKKGDLVEIRERRLVQTVGTNTQMWLRSVLPQQANVWVQSGFLDEKGNITARVNGRAGPSLMWPVLCLFSKGDAVNVRTNAQDWVGVVPPRTASAWVAAPFVTNETTNIPTAPIAPQNP